MSQKPLRTGDRIELGDWTLGYFREEFADHGIPFGGQHGSDPDPVQQEPRPRGTSPREAATAPPTIPASTSSCA